MAEKPVKQQKRYLSYLLRLWQENGGDPPGGDQPQWRASLEWPRSDKRQGFASLEDLFAFLERETGSGSPRPERSDEGGCQPPASSE
jgi:hypothetical protein